MSFYTHDKLIIIGTVGKTAEMRYSPKGDAVTSFSIAVDRSYKKDGEQIKRTIWYRAVVFGKLAEICKDIDKGDKVYIEGELQADWSTGSPKIFDKQNGKGASFEVVVRDIKFLSPKKTHAFEPAGPDVGDGENFPF